MGRYLQYPIAATKQGVAAYIYSASNEDLDIAHDISIEVLFKIINGSYIYRLSYSIMEWINSLLSLWRFIYILKKIKKIPALDPKDKFKDSDIKLVIEFYDEYANDIFELMLTLNINLTKYSFNYRKYFKDGFLKYIEKLNILIDLTSGSYNRIINMQTYHIMSSEQEDN